MLMAWLYFAANRGTENVVAGEVSQKERKRCPARADGGCMRPTTEETSTKP